MRDRITKPTIALGKVLSTPAGVMLMYNYWSERGYSRRCDDQLNESKGKRPTKREVNAMRTWAENQGQQSAYRDALAMMVLDAGGYEFPRRDAVRAVNYEVDEMSRGDMFDLFNEVCMLVGLFY